MLSASSHYHLADVVDKGEHARKHKVLSSAYALKNLESWEYKVADKVERMIRRFDKRCTVPLPGGKHPDSEDLNVDFRMWTNLFSLDAIAALLSPNDSVFLTLATIASRHRTRTDLLWKQVSVKVCIPSLASSPICCGVVIIISSSTSYPISSHSTVARPRQITDGTVFFYDVAKRGWSVTEL